jgi:hypothetical protein
MHFEILARRSAMPMIMHHAEDESSRDDADISGYPEHIGLLRSVLGVQAAFQNQACGVNPLAEAGLRPAQFDAPKWEFAGNPGDTVVTDYGKGSETTPQRNLV